MKLENEIYQKKFRNQFHKLAVNLLYTHGWFLENHSRILDEFSISRQQFNILRILRGQHPNPATVNLLKERMLDKKSDVSRILDKLCIKELTEREICLADRRKADVKITEKGLNLLQKIDESNSKFDSILANLTESEAETLNSLLDKMRS
ncbi:MAG: MarR family transcriptional regulator [Ignavibacteria bacterium]|nr:MarR family transcriptional regulator [Ignavibacteria bacterium]